MTLLLSNNLIANTLSLAEPFVQHWESFQPKPYLCPTGHATIGFGLTVYPNGIKVLMSDKPITLQQAQSDLTQILKNTINLIEPFLEFIPTVHELAAMASCAYNIGTYGFDHSTIIKEFDLGDIQKSADAFLLWDKGKDVFGHLVEIPGLRNRRLAERLFFLTQDIP